MAKKGKEGKDARGGEEAAVISDARFSKMQADPRFLNVPTKKKKVVVDDRFKVCVGADMLHAGCICCYDCGMRHLPSAVCAPS